jgi:hypothetical protein
MQRESAIIKREIETISDWKIKGGVSFLKNLLNGKLTPKARLCEREWSTNASLWA